jgi:hypothetical protein
VELNKLFQGFDISLVTTDIIWHYFMLYSEVFYNTGLVLIPSAFITYYLLSGSKVHSMLYTFHFYYYSELFLLQKPLINTISFGSYTSFFFWQYWGFNSGPWA